jgi:hypothetical protein
MCTEEMGYLVAALSVWCGLLVLVERFHQSLDRSAFLLQHVHIMVERSIHSLDFVWCGMWVELCKHSLML